MPTVTVGRQASASAVESVEIVCRRCGHRALADVTGVGEGAESVLNEPGTAQRRAEDDAKRDIARTSARARCPKCGRRAPRAFLRFASPYLWISAAFLVAGVLVGWVPTWLDLNMHPADKDICKCSRGTPARPG